MSKSGFCTARAALLKRALCYDRAAPPIKNNYVVTGVRMSDVICLLFWLFHIIFDYFLSDNLQFCIQNHSTITSNNVNKRHL